MKVFESKRVAASVKNTQGMTVKQDGVTSVRRDAAVTGGHRIAKHGLQLKSAICVKNKLDTSPLPEKTTGNTHYKHE